ncbi:MarR family winged helix-turn-helix transcriptional regulator [Rhodoligotrophos ferricapiens]|uniref:MarR family winged helix-turn-helix transcriptional regulator n=1 Tax=Rhodoligotrophos ferricapiens TaxID=3069264 RepID=UPI00315D4D91
MSHSQLEAGFLTHLSLAARKLQTTFDSLIRTHGLTLSRARLLLLLSKAGAVNQTELAGLLELETPTVVRLLDKLQQQGLILRQPVEGDRRAKQVMLTKNARSQVAEVDHAASQMRHLALRDIAEADLVVASRVLDQVIRNIEALTGNDLLPAENVSSETVPHE